MLLRIVENLVIFAIGQFFVPAFIPDISWTEVKVSVGCWLLPLTVIMLAILRLRVIFFCVVQRRNFTVNFFDDFDVKFFAKFLSRFTANG